MINIDDLFIEDEEDKDRIKIKSEALTDWVWDEFKMGLGVVPSCFGCPPRYTLLSIVGVMQNEYGGYGRRAYPKEYKSELKELLKSAGEHITRQAEQIKRCSTCSFFNRCLAYADHRVTVESFYKVELRCPNCGSEVEFNVMDSIIECPGCLARFKG